MDDKVPALPIKASIDKQGKLVVQFGVKIAKFKPLDYSAKEKEYSGLLVTKFLWDETKMQWEAFMRKEDDVKAVKKSLFGVNTEAADSIVRRIHDDLFGSQGGLQ